jgi:hypothetical protein
MRGELFWRGFAAVVGLWYAWLGFRAGLRDEKLWILADCMIAGLYFHGAARAHSRVMRLRRSNGSR